MTSEMGGTIEKYLLKIREITTKSGTFAYRGQRNSEWLLHSGATRRLIKDYGEAVVSFPDFSKRYLDYHEKMLIDPARTRRFDFEDGQKISDLQLLAKLQHFGAATGLLDFTWSALVALYFASISITNPPNDGKLFIVDTDNTIDIASVPSDEREQNLQTIFSRADQSSPRLLYWEPIWSGEAMTRILRQRSVFILGCPLVPEGDLIKEISIAKEDKVLLREDLAFLDVTNSSLFQDIYGLSQNEKAPPTSSQRSSTQVTKPEDYLRQGNQFYQQRDYPKAISSYNQCIGLLPEGVSELYFLRGNAKAEMRDYSGAKLDYDLAVVHKKRPYLNIAPNTQILDNPWLWMTYFNRANIKVQLKDFEGALQDYNGALPLKPQEWQMPALYFNRANANVILHKFNDAMKDYDEAEKLGAPDALFNKGNVLVVIGRFKEAFEHYDKTILEGIGNSGIGAVNNRNEVLGIINKIEGVEDKIHVSQIGLPGEMPSTVVEVVDDVRAIEHFSFHGNVGNTGNFGGNRLPGGKGFPGGQGFSVQILGKTDKDE